MVKRQKKKEKVRREGAGDRKEERRGKILSLESMEIIKYKYISHMGKFEEP